MRQNLRRFARLGLDSALTEVDVRTQLPVTSAEPGTAQTTVASPTWTLTTSLRS
jgi:GH35 family endo-1,4-beta-xylanase